MPEDKKEDKGGRLIKGDHEESGVMRRERKFESVEESGVTRRTTKKEE